jgi:hypothetical protein
MHHKDTAFEDKRSKETGGTAGKTEAKPAAPSSFAFSSKSAQTPGLSHDGEDTTPLPAPDIFDLKSAGGGLPKPVPVRSNGNKRLGAVFTCRADAPKIAIIGGKGTGKNYLFQAIVSRSLQADKVGALTYYLDREGIRLHAVPHQKDPSQILDLQHFMSYYHAWKPLPQISPGLPASYRLSLSYQSGLLGSGRSQLDVQYVQSSGEEVPDFEYLGREMLALWKAAYLDASVMVFCLPLWVAFPEEDLSEPDWMAREQMLKDFHQVVSNYQKLRQQHGCKNPVRGVLALTMADDLRVAIPSLRDRWIMPYLDAPEVYLREFAKGHGLVRYMANARKVSEALRQRFAKLGDHRVRGIPDLLDFNNRPPWMIPLSAVEGKTLELVEKRPQSSLQGQAKPPVPVHVELPLLIALCERENALM